MQYDISAIIASLEATANQLIKEMRLPTAALSELLPLVGKLLAAEAYCSGSGVPTLSARSYNDCISFILKYTQLCLKCDTAGEVNAMANVHLPSVHQLICFDPPAGEPLEVEHDKNGNTYYIIQNLNIYLTADVVQQLNINPQQVINQLHEQIKEEINKTSNKGNN